MEFAVEHLGRAMRLAPRGRIDSATADELSGQLNRLIDGGCERMVIDFRDVPYVTSAGFRSLLLADARLRGVAGRLALCGMSPEMHRLFEMGAFTEIFTIAATVDEALASLAPEGR